MRVLLFFIFFCTISGMKAHGALMIYTPGQDTKYIDGDGAGYTVIDSEGVTQIMQSPGVTMISKPHGPTEFIFDSNPLQSPTVVPTLPVVPGEDFELSIPYQPAMPGPNGEWDL